MNAVMRQGQAPRAAQENREPQLRLDPAHGLRDGGLRYGKLFCRKGKAAGIGNGNQNLELTQGDVHRKNRESYIGEPYV